MRAGLWGFLAASALPLGALVAMRFTLSTRTVGAIMAFGAGTLITAVTFELVDQAFERADLWPVCWGWASARLFTVGDAILVSAVVDDSWRGTAPVSTQGDGGLPSPSVPCSTASRSRFVLGISLASGGAVSSTFLIAVFVSNVPESLARTRGMLDDRLPTRSRAGALARGRSPQRDRRRLRRVLDRLDQGVVAIVQSFAAGALLALIADSLLPEAYRDSGLRTGLFVVLGFAPRSASPPSTDGERPSPAVPWEPHALVGTPP